MLLGCGSTVQRLPKSSAHPAPQKTPPHPSPPPGSLWPRGTRESPSLLSLPQGCFSTFGRTLQRYISLPGTCSLAVLGIEVMREAGDRAGRRAPLCGRGGCSVGKESTKGLRSVSGYRAHSPLQMGQVKGEGRLCFASPGSPCPGVPVQHQDSWPRPLEGHSNGPRPGTPQPLSASNHSQAQPCHGADPLPPPSFQIFAMFFAFCLYYNFD